MIRINLLPYVKTKKRENVLQQVFIFLFIVLIVGFGLFWYNSKLNKQINTFKSQIEYSKNEIVKYKKIEAEVEQLKQKLAILKKKLEVIQDLDSKTPFAFQLLDKMSELVLEKNNKKKRMWFTKLETTEKVLKPPEDDKAKKGKGKAKEAAEDKAASGDKKAADAKDAKDTKETPDAKETKKGKGAKKPDIAEVEVPKSDIEIKIDGIALDNKTVADFMTRLEETKLYSNVKLNDLKRMNFKQGKDKPDLPLMNFQVAFKLIPPKKPNAKPSPATSKDNLLKEKNPSDSEKKEKS